MKKLLKACITITLTLIITFSGLAAYAKPAARKTGAAPSSPLSLTYSNLTSTEVTLSYSAVLNATGYKIYRAALSDANYTLIATVTSTSYKNINLTPNTKYYYYVRAYNSYGTSLDSPHINITTMPVTTNTTKKLVLGFTTYYYSGDTSSYNSMSQNISSIDEIASNTFVTDALGNITGSVPTNQITLANSNNIKALAMITNNFDGNIAKTLLESTTNRQALINNIISNLTFYGYKGVNIDLEGVYYYDRSYLTSFISEVYSKLHSNGFYVTLSLPAKTSDSATDAWSGAYDYAALSQYCDQAVIMTYDEHYPGGTAGPVASIGWTENVIKFAASVIPSNKLLLGCASYGYDWSASGTKAYSINGILNLANTYSAVIKWDDVSKESYFNYTDNTGAYHTVWFENGQGVGYKLDLVNSYNLSGIAIWRLGLENADYFNIIKTKFNR